MKELTVAQKLSVYPVDFLSAKEVAEIFGVTTSAIYKRKKRIAIPVDKIGSRLVFLRTLLKSWAQEKQL